MRMWNVDPRVLCDKHLMGEHVETHMFIGTVKRGVSVEGYIRDKLFDPPLLEYRHDQLADEMLDRGIKHTSPIEVLEVLLQRYGSLPLGTVDESANLAELVRRCPNCRISIEATYGHKWNHIPRGGDKVFRAGEEWRIQLSGREVRNTWKTRATALQALERLRKLEQGRR